MTALWGSLPTTAGVVGIAVASVVGAVVGTPRSPDVGAVGRVPTAALRSWIAVVGVSGMVLPAGAVVVDRVAGEPVGAASALLVGLLAQVLVEAMVTRCGRPASRAWVGVAGTTARLVQVAVLWTTTPVMGLSGVSLVAASVVWPVNLVVLILVLRSRRCGVAT